MEDIYLQNTLKSEDLNQRKKYLKQLYQNNSELLPKIQEKIILAFLYCTDYKQIKLKNNHDYDDQGFSGQYKIDFDGTDPVHDNTQQRFAQSTLPATDLQVKLDRLLNFISLDFSKKNSYVYTKSTKIKQKAFELEQDFLKDDNKIFELFKTVNQLDHKKNSYEIVDIVEKINKQIKQFEAEENFINSFQATDILYNFGLDFSYIHSNSEKMYLANMVLQNNTIGQKNTDLILSIFEKNKNFKRTVLKQYTKNDFSEKNEELLKSYIMSSYFSIDDHLLYHQNGEKFTIQNIKDMLKKNFDENSYIYIYDLSHETKEKIKMIKENQFLMSQLSSNTNQPSIKKI